MVIAGGYQAPVDLPDPEPDVDEALVDEVSDDAPEPPMPLEAEPDRPDDP